MGGYQGAGCRRSNSGENLVKRDDPLPFVPQVRSARLGRVSGCRAAALPTNARRAAADPVVGCRAASGAADPAVGCRAAVHLVPCESDGRSTRRSQKCALCFRKSSDSKSKNRSKRRKTPSVRVLCARCCPAT